MFGSIVGISEAHAWQEIAPDAHGDWLKLRDASFATFIALGDKRAAEHIIFENYTRGVQTGRDPWCYNYSRSSLVTNVQCMLDFYNQQVVDFADRCGELSKDSAEGVAKEIISKDPTRIKWTEDLIKDVSRGLQHDFNANSIRVSIYRPFTKCWMYSNQHLNWSRYMMPKILPDTGEENLVICVSGTGDKLAFSALISGVTPALHMVDIEGSQCFPLYLYDSAEPVGMPPQSGLFDVTRATQTECTRRAAITDAGLAHFKSAYPAESIGKEDLFYYVYGLLHSSDYRERYADNLSKELPRIPCVKTSVDFWAFSTAGRLLAELHLNYETVPMYTGATIDTGGKKLTDADYRVEKMRYGKSGKNKDLSTLHYNGKITVTGIPLEAYDYVVNGKPALDWVIERQCVKTDKDSGIVNDANDWAIDTMHNPRYPLDLFLRVITVSLETMKIVRSLPALEI